MNAFSISRDDYETVQQVSAWFRGALYPGEAIIAEEWRRIWGEALAGSSMFRVVLLARLQDVPPGDIRDQRIVVAISGGGGRSSLSGPAAMAASQLREVAAKYRLATDSGLDGVARAVERRSVDLEADISREVRGGFLEGHLAAGAGGPAIGIGAVTAFHSRDAGEWVEALGAAALARRYGDRCWPPSGVSLQPDEIAAVFDWLGRGAAPESRPPSAGAARLDDAGNPAYELLAALQEHGQMDASGIRALLMHEVGLPPEVAFLHLSAAILLLDGEIVWRPRTHEVPRLLRDDLADLAWQPGLFEEVAGVRGSVAGDWDSALGYLRPVLSSAEPSAEIPLPVQAAEFEEELVALRARSAMASSLYDRVASAAGQGRPGDKSRAEAIDAVLDAENWKTFYENARRVFGRPSVVAEELEHIRQRRRISPLAIEIEQTISYLKAAEAGLAEGTLKIRAGALSARIDLASLARNPSLWPSIAAGFSSWRDEYCRSYLSLHRTRREEDEHLVLRVEECNRQAEALRWYSGITGPGGAGSETVTEALTERWTALSVDVTVCSRSDEDVELVDLVEFPICSECRMVPAGEPPVRDDLLAVMAEVDRALAEFNTRLSRAAIDDLLAGKRPDEVEKLLKINNAAELKALSGLLDDGVIHFLQEYLSART